MAFLWWNLASIENRHFLTFPHRLQYYTMTTVQPHASLSAQQAAQNNPERCGFLRKRGKKERVLENLHLSRHFNWRQRFVVIKDGCCYCYDNETSKTPHQTFSLEGYQRVQRRPADTRASHVFALEPGSMYRLKIHTFTAMSEDEMKLWMQAFRSAMMEANSATSASGGSCRSSDDGFSELEKPVFLSDDESSPAGNRFPRGTGSFDEDEYSSDDSDYDKPDEGWRLPDKGGSDRRALPPLPPHNDVPAKPTSNTQQRPALAPPHKAGDGVRIGGGRPNPPDPLRRDSCPAPPTKKPPTAAKPKRRLSECDCLFDDSDREAAIQILREKVTPGTFLIRKSRQGDSKVLAVLTVEDVKEYKIFTLDNRVTLDKKDFFNCVDDLLENYTKNPLPNRTQTLTRSYSMSQH